MTELQIRCSDGVTEHAPAGPEDEPSDEPRIAHNGAETVARAVPGVQAPMKARRTS